LRYNQLEDQEGDRNIIIEMDLKEVGCEDRGRIELAHHHHAQCISVLAMLNLWVLLPECQLIRVWPDAVKMKTFAVGHLPLIMGVAGFSRMLPKHAITTWCQIQKWKHEVIA
jgi:hypothetical protein